MTAASSNALSSGAEVLWPRPEAAGVADAMIEAEKTPTPGRAMDESVASSWAYAVKATLASLGAYAALTAPTKSLLGLLQPGRKTPGFWVGEIGQQWRSRWSRRQFLTF